MGSPTPIGSGISGLSYGGFMSGWAVTQTDQFRGGPSRARSSRKTTSRSLLRGNGRLCRDDPRRRLVRPGGPIPRALTGLPCTAGASTPTLVIQGQMDRCTPVGGRGRELFGAIALTGAGM